MTVEMSKMDFESGGVEVVELLHSEKTSLIGLTK